MPADSPISLKQSLFEDLRLLWKAYRITPNRKHWTNLTSLAIDGAECIGTRIDRRCKAVYATKPGRLLLKFLLIAPLIWLGINRWHSGRGFVWFTLRDAIIPSLVIVVVLEIMETAAERQRLRNQQAADTADANTAEVKQDRQ